jgi:sulfite reductase (ferredoxin)
MQTYRIPAALPREIDALEDLIGGFRAGAVSAAELKARRVPFGIYEQRVKDNFMVRIRCAAGIITPHQLRRVAELSLEHASGRLHITTRQEIQMHDVCIERLVPILRFLYSVGLSSRGGGGNTVRNITASWDSGVSRDEIFDVTPHAVELTSRLIARADSWLLPRKMKIAFSNLGSDSAFATVNDLGFIAHVRNGQRGFRVFVAGGMGRAPEPAHLLHDFVPEDQVFVVAESVKRLFSEFGNRRNRHTARLRFLWNALGRDGFLAKYEMERASLEAEKPDPFECATFTAGSAPVSYPEALNESSAEFDHWKIRYVRTQRSEDYHSVRIPFLLGDIDAEKAIALADFLAPLGDDVIRFTQDQNIVLRNIPQRILGNIFRLSEQVTSLRDAPPVFANAVACAGASTCQLGICLSRNALRATIDHLKTSDINFDAMSDFRIHFSGCSNSCGQHGIAHLGFFGKAGRKGTDAYPAYSIVAGAKIDSSGGTSLARKIDTVAARDVPCFVEKFLRHFASRKNSFVSFAHYLDQEGERVIRSICETFRQVHSREENEEYYRDWGSNEPFNLASRGTGECAAGLFDLIEIDLKKMREARDSLTTAALIDEKEAILRNILLLSARALLITRGLDAGGDEQTFDLFRKNFIDTGLIHSGFCSVIDEARKLPSKLSALESAVVDISREVEKLYASLDDSLQFQVPASLADAATVPDLEKDFRGIACPMNFVKTKMALARLRPGQTLRVLLDGGEPVDNVPKSAAAEGHLIVSQIQQGDHWAITIRKAP